MKNLKSWLLVGIVILLGMCVLVVAALYFPQRNRAFNARPLVLIHNPVNHEQVSVGENLVVHATAREDSGLSRIELWVDGVLVATKDAPESGPTTLVLSTPWTVSPAGTHVVIVRAVSKAGVDGQATVTVEALESAASEPAPYIVQEGETLESIALSTNTTPEELADANPGIGPSGPALGDELTVPDGEPPAVEEEVPPLPEDREDAPLPEADAPGSIELFGGIFELVPFFPSGERVSEPVALRVEVLSLSTSRSFERFYCYISAGSSTPRWYPDTDDDQSTDESFTLSGSGGMNEWNVGDYMVGEAAPTIFWPADQPLTVGLSCVGITGGGTETVEMGLVERTVPPEEWNGALRHEGIMGPNGSMYFDFRVTQPEGGGRGFPLFLDPEMTPPYNARLDDRRISLRWDYTPRPDEEPITGFRIYLNGNLQWTEPADARESGLPYEWFHPPCGTTYTFAVSAYRFGLPDGPESMPAIVILPQPAEGCTRELLVTFLTLETFDLGGDGSHPAHDGDVGPVYGDFFANERQISFDTRSPGSGGSLDRANGLRNNALYNLGDLSADRTWRFTGMPAVGVDVPPGGTFEFGFHIMDDDTDDDDTVCEGFSVIYEDHYGQFDELHEGALTSEDGRCRVTFQWGPVAGSPVGSGVEGWEPLPWISLEDFVVNEDTGSVQLHIRNTGTATWPWRDLQVELQTRDGASLGVFTWPEFVLETGQRTVLENPDMRLELPFDACVLIDPFDEVLEEFERSGAMVHQPICPRMPDLIVADAHYSPSGGNGQILLTIQNISDSPLEHRVLSVQTYLPDGTLLYVGGSRPDISLGRYETITFGLGGVSESIREQMQAGYSVVVNPDRRIVESNMDNNTFQVPAADNLRVTVMAAHAPWDYRNSSEYNVNIVAISGSARRSIASWHIEDLDWNSCTRESGCGVIYPNAFEGNDTVWFPMYGDEILEVTVRASNRGGDWSITETYLPQDNWDSNNWGSRRDCRDWTSATGWHNWRFSTHEGHTLGLTFQVCHEGP